MSFLTRFSGSASARGWDEGRRRATRPEGRRGSRPGDRHGSPLSDSRECSGGRTTSHVGISIRLVVLACGLGLWAPSAGAQPPRNQGIENSGAPSDPRSRPVWEKPPVHAVASLAEAARAAQSGVLLVGHPDAGFGTAFVISRAHRLV